MSKKIPLGITLTMVFAAVALTVAITVSLYSGYYNSLIRDLPQRTQQYSVLSEIDGLIRDKYYGETDNEALLGNIADGYVKGLGDSGCFYIAEDALEAYKSAVGGYIAGTGITAVFDSGKGCLTVTDIAAGSPAADMDIKNGTLISEVDGVKVTRENAASLISRLLYSDKKNIDIGIPGKSDKGEDILTKRTVPCGYEIRSCTYKTVGSVGYVYFSDFYGNAAEQFRQAADEFAAAGITSLIIDVRNNAGINYDNVYAVIDAIVPIADEGTGAIAEAVNASGETVKLVPSDADTLSMQIAVLINGKTSGAAELLACDLRDFGKAKLFGEKTAGSGRLPELIPLESGGAVMLTTALIRPYKSEPYDGVGVSPDEAVPAVNATGIPPEVFEEDNQFNAAYIFLTK